MRRDGDFTTTGERKSENAAFQEYWAYPNGWIALGSLRLGRVDVAYPAFDYLRAHDLPAVASSRTGAQRTPMTSSTP
jgi:hypothetical protein